jgi:mono/diheme cytochrome c family protein
MCRREKLCERHREKSRVGCRPHPWWRCAVGAFALCALAGCGQDMADQPRYEPFEASSAFSNGLSSRDPVPGTVARGQLELDTPFFTGKQDGQLVTELPARVLEGKTMAELLARGQERFNIYCSQCHGQVGGGTGGSDEMLQAVGMVVKRGFPVPPTYHQERLRNAPIGHFFDVITNGLGRMPAHGYLVRPEDRWAIAAYIRALQLSQYASSDQLTPSDLKQLDIQATSPSP